MRINFLEGEKDQYTDNRNQRVHFTAMFLFLFHSTRKTTGMHLPQRIYVRTMHHIPHIYVNHGTFFSELHAPVQETQ